ncbi:hypothetical protein D3C71_2014070 [compost metagenome]
MRPTSTPSVETTSVIKCRPSASMAGDFARRPWRTSTWAQTRLTAVATTLTASPWTGASGICGARNPKMASRRMRMAATMIITPTSTAEKYSAL